MGRGQAGSRAAVRYTRDSIERDFGKPALGFGNRDAPPNVIPGTALGTDENDAQDFAG